MKHRLARTCAAMLVACGAIVSSQYVTAHAAVTAPFDTTFGTNGMAVHELPLQRSESQVSDVLRDSNDNLYVLNIVSQGNTSGVTIAKYSSNGSVVSDFGTNGRSKILDLESATFAFQADGKIVVAGFGYSGYYQAKIVVYRLTTTGQVDTTFGTDGSFIQTSFPGKGFGYSNLFVAVNQTNDRIHLGFNIENGLGTNNNFYFIALNSSGSLDYNWGYGGAREVAQKTGGVSAISILTSMLLLSDGSLLGIGSAFNNNGYTRDLVLVKINSGGWIDTTFDGASNGNGVVYVQFGSETDAYLTAATMLQDDSVVIAGVAGSYYWGPWYYGITKILSDGTVDTSFGTNGFTLSSLPADFSSTLPRRTDVQADGRFVFPINTGSTAGFMRVEADGTLSNSQGCSQCLWTGSDSDAAATSLVVQSNDRIVVAGMGKIDKKSIVRRFTASGTSDGTFTNINLQINAERWSSYIQRSEVLADGSILGFGVASVERGYTGLSRAVVFKFNANGAMDTTFGLGGYQLLAPPSDNYSVSVSDFTVQPDGKIVVLATAWVNPGLSPLLLWRLSPDGSLDNSFGADGPGYTIMEDSVSNLSPRALIPTSDGKFIVPLTKSAPSGPDSPWIYRFTSTGQPDTSFTDGQSEGGVNRPIGNDTESINMGHAADNGKFYISGTTYTNGNPLLFIARYLPDGSWDPTFSGGYVTWDPWAQNPTNPISYVAGLHVDSNGKIFVLGSSTAAGSTGAVVQLSANGLQNTAFNGSGFSAFAFRNPNDVDWAGPTDWVFNDGTITIVGGGDADTRGMYNRPFSGVARMSTSGTLDNEFGMSGILDPFPATESDFYDIAPLGNGRNLVVGMIKDEGRQKILLMRIGQTLANTTTSTSTTTTTTTSTLPPVTTTQPATTAASDEIRLSVSTTQAAILKKLNITVPKGGKVSMKSTTARVCRVSGTKVLATSTGTCRISVTVTVKGKKSTKTLAIKVN